MYRLRHSKTPSWNKSKTAFSALASERTFHGKAACEKAGVRPIPVWWSWGELNPRPKDDPQEHLRAQYAIYFHYPTGHIRPAKQLAP